MEVEEAKKEYVRVVHMASKANNIVRILSVVKEKLQL